MYGTALYLDMLVLGSGTYLNLDGVHVYYNTLVNNGGSWGLANNGALTQLAYLPSNAQVPEPSAFLIGSGLIGLAFFRKRLIG